MITARAIGVLEEILINPQHGGAKGLSARLGGCYPSGYHVTQERRVRGDRKS